MVLFLARPSIEIREGRFRSKLISTSKRKTPSKCDIKVEEIKEETGTRTIIWGKVREGEKNAPFRSPGDGSNSDLLRRSPEVDTRREEPS